jgi:hypothetical protein
MDTSLSETHSSLTVTLTVLEMDPTTYDDFDVADDKDDSSVQEHGSDAKMPAPNPFSSVFSDTFDSETEDEEEVVAKDTPVDDCTTVAEQVEIHIGRSITAEASNNNNQDMFHNSTPNEANIALSPIDCATLDILKRCHDGGVSLEFYDNFLPCFENTLPKTKWMSPSFLDVTPSSKASESEFPHHSPSSHRSATCRSHILTSLPKCASSKDLSSSTT